MLSVIAISVQLGPLLLLVLMAFGPSLILAMPASPIGRAMKRAIYGSIITLALILAASIFYLAMAGPRAA